jgi:hypothetical protein
MLLTCTWRFANVRTTYLCVYIFVFTRQKGFPYHHWSLSITSSSCFPYPTLSPSKQERSCTGLLSAAHHVITKHATLLTINRCNFRLFSLTKYVPSRQEPCFRRRLATVPPQRCEYPERPGQPSCGRGRICCQDADIPFRYVRAKLLIPCHACIET